MSTVSFLAGIFTGAVGSVIVFLLVLFRIRLWVPNAGVRTSGELVKRDLSQALAKTKPADESISQPSISSLLDPYFSSDTLPPASLASVVERFHSDAVAARDGPETAIWVNVLVAHALKFLRDFGDELDSLSGGDSKEQGGSFLAALINSALATAPRPPVVGPVRVVDLGVGTVAPILHSVEVLSSDPGEPLIVELAFTYTGDSRVEVATSLDVPFGNPPIMSLPVQVALSNIFVSGVLRICVDTSLASPGLSLCLIGEPILRFDLASALGYQVQLVNVPHLHGLLYKVLTDTIRTQIVAPHIVSVTAPAGLIADLKAKALLALKENQPVVPEEESKQTARERKHV